MLDKTIKYYEVIMKREKGTPLLEYLLPEGYRYVMYSPGDELSWAEIETSVGEFNKVEDALEYYSKKYLPYIDELKRRCLFVENSKGKKIATLTAWWSYTDKRRDPWLQWFSVMPECQNKSIGKALVYECMKLLIEIEGDHDVYLPTQTWSYKAINIYRKQGFKIIPEKGLGGFKNENYELVIELLKDYMR